MGKTSKKLKSLLSLDFFDETIGLKINGQHSHKSAAGVFLSISILVLVCSFAINKLVLCLSYSDTKHQTYSIKNHFDIDKEYSFDNFSMTYALVDPNSLEPIQDLDKFARLEAYQTITSGLDTKRERLATHSCTQQDLNYRFENIEDYVLEYWESYQCLDHPEHIVF